MPWTPAGAVSQDWGDWSWVWGWSWNQAFGCHLGHISCYGHGACASRQLVWLSKRWWTRCLMRVSSQLVSALRSSSTAVHWLITVSSEITTRRDYFLLLFLFLFYFIFFPLVFLIVLAVWRVVLKMPEIWVTPCFETFNWVTNKSQRVRNACTDSIDRGVFIGQSESESESSKMGFGVRVWSMAGVMSLTFATNALTHVKCLSMALQPLNPVAGWLRVVHPSCRISFSGVVQPNCTSLLQLDLWVSSHLPAAIGAAGVTQCDNLRGWST